MKSKWRRYVKVSDDGRYGLARPDALGYSELFRIAPGNDPDFPVGLLSDPDNFEYGIQEAEEESRVLAAAAREEFGF
ncbi:MAG TPA: hypothetical protein VMX12_03180 [Acidimicrobiia bacterium]|nr:hypothetical protein [Acidimicrobiia bacterium]